MNTIGCSFFVGLHHRVKYSSRAASMIALMLKTSAKLPVSLNTSTLSSDIPTTSTPAAAISPVDAGRSP